MDLRRRGSVIAYSFKIGLSLSERVTLLAHPFPSRVLDSSPSHGQIFKTSRTPIDSLQNSDHELSPGTLAKAGIEVSDEGEGECVRTFTLLNSLIEADDGLEEWL